MVPLLVPDKQNGTGQDAKKEYIFVKLNLPLFSATFSSAETAKPEENLKRRFAWLPCHDYQTAKKKQSCNVRYLHVNVAHRTTYQNFYWLATCIDSVRFRHPHLPTLRLLHDLPICSAKQLQMGLGESGKVRQKACICTSSTQPR